MAKKQDITDIIRDALNTIDGTGRQRQLLKRQKPAVRRRSKGSYRDQLADANRFGGERPERKVVKTLMSYPPIKVYNDGSRERVKPSGGTKRKPATMPNMPKRKRKPNYAPMKDK